MKTPVRYETKHATLYDAIAGRIKKHHATGFLHTRSHITQLGTTASETDSVNVPPPVRQESSSRAKSKASASPNEALAARLSCAESELPTASREQLEALPDSDLLDAIHDYASALYSGDDHCGIRSMDESALLIMGIIAEELTDDVIGEEGHLMLEDRDHHPIEPSESQDLSPDHIKKLTRVEAREEVMIDLASLDTESQPSGPSS